MTTQLIRGTQRHHWRNEWLESWQSFPATGNFDLSANAHGVLLVHNDDRVDAGEGLDMHHHHDAEIVTWVLEGTLHHRDSRGHRGTLGPGVIQRMSAGRGITHAEGNASSRRDGVPLRVVQMWIAPDRPGGEPGYAEHDFTEALSGGTPVVVVSGLARDVETAAVPLESSHAALHVARLRDGQEAQLPGSPFGHLYVASGEVLVDGVGPLEQGDAVRLTDSDGVRLVGGEEAEILYWEMHASFELR